MAWVCFAPYWPARVVDKAFRAWTKARYDHVIQLPVLPSQGERFLARYRVR